MNRAKSSYRAPEWLKDHEYRLTRSDPRIAFWSGGSGQGTPLVLLHSLAVDYSTWAPVVEVLERGHRVVLMDSRGHGSSDSSEQASPSLWAEDVIAVLDALEIEQAVLVGVSMGGIQVIATAATAPERVAGLVVADSFPFLPEETAGARVQGMVDYASAHSMEDVARQYVRDTFVVPTDQRCPDLVLSAMAAMSPADYKIAVQACFTADVRSLLEQVQAPALVLWGDQDAKTPRAFSEAIASGISDATLVSIPGAGHLSHLDQPERFAALVSEFARTLQLPVAAPSA